LAEALTYACPTLADVIRVETIDVQEVTRVMDNLGMLKNDPATISPQAEAILQHHRPNAVC
jgi:hypothetical protein